MLRKLALIASLFAMALPFSAHAQPLQTTDVLIAPTCLYQQVDTSLFEFLATDKDYALIKTDQKGLDAFIQAKDNRKPLCGGFKNVTHEWQQTISTQSASLFLKQHIAPVKAQAVHYSIQYEKEVRALIQQMVPQDMWTDLGIFTQFHNRCAYSNNGVNASDWLLAQAKQLAEKAGRTDVTYETVAVPHPYFMQKSVIVKVGSGTGPGIVIGAHMDTLCLREGRFPGADDDGTGSVTVLEDLRLVLNSPMRFKKPIYFIWYAAEEEGLVGSQAVVQEFIDKKIPIDAVIQFDMTGYQIGGDRSMWLIDDFVNKDLTSYLALLIDTYIKEPVKHTACGYGCSDHASWTAKGYPAAMPAETAFSQSNPYIHTADDIMAHLSLQHMTDYAALAIAFTVELAEPEKV